MVREHVVLVIDLKSECSIVGFGSIARDVNVIGGAILIERRHARQIFQVNMDLSAEMAMEITADDAARVAQTSGMVTRSRIEQEPSGFHRGAAHHYHAGSDLFFLPGLTVDDEDPACQALLVDQDLAR